MINKIDIINGAYQLLRISGITVSAQPNDIVLALGVLDDYAAELKPTLDIGYIQPSEYGQSDPNDYSGLTVGMAGPIKKMLALELVTFFGKQPPASLISIASAGMKSLEQQLVNVSDMQNPPTLPIGSGNEYVYIGDKFYQEPTNDKDAIDYFQNEVFQEAIDWNPWLTEEFTLDSVVYTADSGVSISNDSFVEGVSVATIGFTTPGQMSLCITATNSNGDVKNKRFVYKSINCQTVYP